MSLKITTLIENMADREEKLKAEHGFSVFVETDGRKILFDTGQTGAFAQNAKDLGINLAETDMVILSHGHYDHTGGVPKLLEYLNKRIPCYIGKEFFSPKYKRLEDGSYKYNGNPFAQDVCEEIEFRYIEEDVTKLSERLLLFKNFSRVNDFEKVNPKFYVKKGQEYAQDLFPDEIALGVVIADGLVLIVGCSHVGLVNILEHVKKTVNLPVAAVLGGTHLVEAEESRLQKTVDALRLHGVKTIAVSHCTGEAGMALLRQEFPEGFMLNNTGNRIEF